MPTSRVCPECGGPMGYGAKMCARCRYPKAKTDDRKMPPNSRETALFGVTVTFENAAGKTFVIHRVGQVKKAVRQACEDALTLDQTFRVVCVSNPTSIYTDMQGHRIRSFDQSDELTQSDRPSSPEATMLSRAGIPEMLHPRLRA